MYPYKNSACVLLFWAEYLVHYDLLDLKPLHQGHQGYESKSFLLGIPTLHKSCDGAVGTAHWKLGFRMK
jgi:hypothetical protein